MSDPTNNRFYREPMTDRYAEGIAEGRRQAFAEAAEIAREIMKTGRGGAPTVLWAIEAAAKGGKG